MIAVPEASATVNEIKPVLPPTLATVPVVSAVVEAVIVAAAPWNVSFSVASTLPAADVIVIVDTPDEPSG